MPLYFIVVGCFALVVLFFFDCKKLKNLSFLFALILLLVGFFVGEIGLKKVSINVPFLVGAIILCVAFALSNPHRKLWRALVCSVGFTLVYLSLNLITIDLNVFFSVVPICAVGVLAGLIGGKDGLLCSMFTLIFCEIVNAFVMMEHLGFWALYSQNFVFCIVLVGSVVLLFNIVKSGITKLSRKKKRRI